MSEKTYPDRFYIIIGEDLRHEGEGQFSLMGINPRGLNGLNVNGENIVPSLAVYCVLYDPEGTFEGKITITDEDHNIVVDAAVPVSTTEDGKTTKLLLAGKFMNVKFSRPGNFNVTISLDDKAYTESFKIKLLE